MLKRVKIVLSLAAFLVGAPAALARGSNVVWVWNSQCSAPTYVVLRVKLGNKTLYTKSLPLCRWKRTFESGKTSFKFTSPRRLAWYGYRSNKGDATAPGTVFTVAFWQAGGEPDAMELGYSVAAKDGLHMNSIHMLFPNNKSTTTMASGLVLVTVPKDK